MAINYTKLLKKGLISLAGGLAEEIAFTALKEISKCLLKLTGFKTKAEKKEDEFRAWAESVTFGLESIEIKVDQLNNQMAAGLKQINTGMMFANYQTQYDLTVGPREIISQAFNELQNIISNSGNKTIEKINTEISKLNEKRAVVHNAALKMADFWGRDPFSQSRNLLENWTDTCILSAGNSNESLELYYNQLEDNFQLGIYTLYKAYSVLVTLKNLETEIEDDDTETAEWLDTEIKNVFEPIVKSFLACTDRLVLSTYHPELGGYPMFANADLVRNITARAEIQAFLILNMDLTVDSPGLLVKEYLRPSMMKNDSSEIKIEIIVPNTAAKSEKSAGKRWKPDGKYTSGPCMPNWYKVTDRNAAEELMSFADSDIVIMNYSHSFVIGELSARFKVSSGYAAPASNKPPVLTKEAVYEYYNIETLAKVPTKNDKSVCMAYVMLTEHVTDPDRAAYPMSYPDSKPSQYEYDYTDSTEWLKKHALGYTISIQGPRGTKNPVKAVSIECSFEDKQMLSDHDFTFITEYPIKYAAKSLSGNGNPNLPGAAADIVKLIFASNSLINVWVGDYKNGNNEMRKGQVEIDIRKTDSEGENEIVYFNHKYDSDTYIENHPIDFMDNTINRPYASNANYIKPGQLIVPIQAGQKTVLRWMVKIWVEGRDGGWHKENNNMKGIIKMYEPRLAWPQPKPGF